MRSCAHIGTHTAHAHARTHKVRTHTQVEGLLAAHDVSSGLQLDPSTALRMLSARGTQVRLGSAYGCVSCASVHSLAAWFICVPYLYMLWRMCISMSLFSRYMWLIHILRAVGEPCRPIQVQCGTPCISTYGTTCTGLYTHARTHTLARTHSHACAHTHTSGSVSHVNHASGSGSRAASLPMITILVMQ